MDINIFLDSGAFSAWSQKKEIDIKQYISFIKENKQYINHYAVLDSIGNPEKTLENQKIMEFEGLTPIPCFHYGEDFSYLEMYVKKYQYIALGGMVPVPTANLVYWLDEIFSKFICNKKDMMPKIKVHGFGLTSIRLLTRYPWYSVDSSSAIKHASYGFILIPKLIKNKIFYEKSYSLLVSCRADKNNIQHIDYLSNFEKSFVIQYLQKINIPLGESIFKKVETGYKIKEKELWFDKDKKIIEIKKILGVINSDAYRIKAMVNFYLEFQKTIPIWPHPFKKRRQGFNL